MRTLKQIYRNMARISAADMAIRRGLSSGRFAFNYWPMTGQECIPSCLAEHIDCARLHGHHLPWGA